jgi:Rps23 Pro-64 3,4-dihydroxylase Tpa1-like proline 4-hydroxylase
MTALKFRLSDRIDWDASKHRFSRRGRVEIDDFLASGQADAVRRHLLARDGWTLVMNAGAKVYEMTREAHGDMNAAQRAELDRLIVNAGREGFQYRYETLRVPDDDRIANPSDLLTGFVAFMSSPEVLERLGYILGHDSAGFADGQATSYGEGHFLTRHDDEAAGKHRRAAYVFSLTPAWRPEWGGLLMFHGDDGHVEEAFGPRMGALRLFSVPQPHSVSYVTPFAPEPRLSITGWLRAHDGANP